LLRKVDWNSIETVDDLTVVVKTLLGHIASVQVGAEVDMDDIKINLDLSPQMEPYVEQPLTYEIEAWR